MAEPDEFAMDPPVAPVRVLGRHLHDQLTDHRCRGRSPATSWPMGPVTGDPPAMPPQQRVRFDDPTATGPATQRLGDRSQQGPIAVVDRRSVDLAAQDCELVPQHDDLNVLGATRPDGEPDEAGHEDIQGASHHLIIGWRSPRSTATAEFPAPTPPIAGLGGSWQTPPQ